MYFFRIELVLLINFELKMMKEMKNLIFVTLKSLTASTFLPIAVTIELKYKFNSNRFTVCLM